MKNIFFILALLATVEPTSDLQPLPDDMPLPGEMYTAPPEGPVPPAPEPGPELWEAE